MSKLDPEIYGPQDSAITEDVIRQEIGGIMTVDEVKYVVILIDTTAIYITFDLIKLCVCACVCVCLCVIK